MERTIIEVKCNSKKETLYNESLGTKNTQIELTVPYSPDSIFYQMSGGTFMTLNTVNQEAADMFKIGGKYMIDISPVVVIPTE